MANKSMVVLIIEKSTAAASHAQIHIDFFPDEKNSKCSIPKQSIFLNKDLCRSWLQLDPLKSVVYELNKLKKYRTDCITPYPNFWHSKISENS